MGQTEDWNYNASSDGWHGPGGVGTYFLVWDQTAIMSHLLLKSINVKGLVDEWCLRNELVYCWLHVVLTLKINKPLRLEQIMCNRCFCLTYLFMGYCNGHCLSPLMQFDWMMLDLHLSEWIYVPCMCFLYVLHYVKFQSARLVGLILVVISLFPCICLSLYQSLSLASLLSYCLR